MVSFPGHIAFGLLFVLPAWILWNRRISVVFVALGVATSLLPDVDLVLQAIFPNEFHHHGVTHTIVFVVGVSIVVGGVVAFFLDDLIDEWTRGDRFTRASLFVFATAAFSLGGLSHLFADALSAPDISTPIEPFWPFIEMQVGFDVVYYQNVWINWGLLVVAVLSHLALAFVVNPFDHRYRVEPSSGTRRR